MEKQFKNDPGCVLDSLADMYRSRGKRYQESYKQVGEVMSVLYPDGKKAITAQDFNEFHLLMMIVVKLVRLVNHDLRHIDSIEDAAVYCAMLRSILMAEDEKSTPIEYLHGTEFYPEKCHDVKR